ncbi:hypothetical protein MNEG_7469 [Monoraphidium neglectum]|jgi:hypothetical protein|uniref:mTERF domain-containing protein n=1 Tax=Monoraphidium neglectum TaxID=145388 RepID=A0A0D2N2U2_9CHLO|nr:hypothetical protein MNEG_7469 [Monoraphidium neglectum]KIZ00491.1 hypothetical protein MNEG_7469 [Monoraphidium neglectum]|eukprot:XP_013899510.1 hypothetical protein MNEG_7469 [Monoraphidium neglectum]
MCRLRPNLRAVDPLELARAADALQSLLELPSRHELQRRVLVNHPQLLTQPPPSWEAHVAALSEGLGAPRGAVLSMCRRHPSLLYSDPDLVLSKMAALRGLLGVDAARAARLAQSFPMLLIIGVGKPAERLAALQDGLGLDWEAVAKMCLVNPQLLITPAETVMANKEAWEEVAAGTGHVADWKTGPLLLTQKSAKVTARWRLLRRLAPLHAPWADWMARRGGAGSILFGSERAWLKVEFLAGRLAPEGAGAAPARAAEAPAAAAPAGGAGQALLVGTAEGAAPATSAPAANTGAAAEGRPGTRGAAAADESAAAGRSRPAGAWHEPEQQTVDLPANGVAAGGLAASARPTLEGAPLSLRQLVAEWSYMNVEAWQPGFMAWLAERGVPCNEPAEPESVAGGNEEGPS